ncbi:hypothetical protein EYC98_21265 [Halieaceae bacterium IMCC14734]|uniref:Uncharacterized protein n=1 Tax=Candidatus Litorirhabdus singularis TaxID=2518993 RepID=A0ABT3TM33_9GAMM|nr:hypothetical protein [Candidatus Litorirhabdus singularis]MCX2983397.1 hypothetical protein [Candidatus Litorirhabdus singularis]
MAKKPITKTVTQSESPTPTTLKEATCKTLEGPAKLTYQIGTDDDGDVYFKITANTGGGFFSAEWVSFAGIQQAFKDWPEDKPINSMTLRPLFRGKSVNTPAFLLAALSAEGLLKPLPKRKRVHMACDPKPFLADVQQLQLQQRSSSRKKPAAKSKAKAKQKALPRKKAPAKKK